MSAQSKRTQREKLKAQGLVPLECWVLPENKQAMKDDEIRYRIKTPYQCYDRMCGSDDCINCHPEYFINATYQEN